MRLSAKLLLLPIVSLLFGVAASSQANEALFSKSSRMLEQLWSGILGCHDTTGASAGFTPRNRFGPDGAAPLLDGPERRDYAACARQSLRNSSSRMLVETIEDGVRHGGVALLGERFRLDSSISWVWGENVRGELDAVIPIWEKEYFDGTGSALFMQHGVVLWNGLESNERIDANFGLVYRSNLNANTIAGGSLFYDHDFKNGHKRLGAGVDMQSGIMHFSANYYHPISDWREGRKNHEEQALQGADFSLGFVLDRVHLNSTLGVWRFEDGIEQNEDDWRSSFDVEGGFQVLPGVFLKGGYEHHDGKNSPDSRWHAGLAFRFSLPGLEGAKVKSESTAAPSLWRTARREKRILYEERVKIIPSVVSIETVATLEEGADPFTMTFAFDKPLEREVAIVLAPTSDSTANPGDYTLIAQAIVTPPISLAGEELSTGARTESSQGRIEMILPRHTTSLNLTITVNNDEARETDELVKLAAYTTGENAQYARFDGVMQVTIPHNDDFTIGFADAFSSVEEDAGTAYLLLQLGYAAPIGGVSVSVDAVGATGDIAFVSPANVTVPAGTPEGQVAQSVASIAVDIIDDNDAEAGETVTFTISEGSGFPASPWQIDPDAATHTMTILASDPLKGDVGFAPGNPASAKEGDTLTLTVMSSATADADLPVTWTAAPAGKVQTATGTVTIANGSDSQTFSLDINDDSASGPAGSITVTLAAPDLPNGWSLDASTHTITIIDNNPTGFVRIANNPSGATLTEPSTITIDVSVTNRAGFIAATSANVELDVEMTTVGDQEIESDLRNNPESADDYTVGSLVINHETGMGSFTFTAEDDDIPEGRESITLTIADPDGNLPDEWNIDDARNWFNVSVPGNDNAARFAEWTRNDPGSFAGLSLTLSEGAINDPPRANFIVLIDHIAPFGNLPFLLSVPDEYRNDIGFRNVENSRTAWDSASGVFTFRRSDNIQQAPNIAAGLEIFAVANDGPEREETFDITLMEAPGWPSEWGSVANTPDIVNPALATATTLSVTIPANGNTVSFAEVASSAIEDAGTHNVPVRTERAFPEPVTLTVATGGTATSGTDYTIESQIVIPEDSTTADIVVTLISDTMFEADETIDLTISGTLPEGWSFGGNTHRITVINDDSGGVVEIAPGNLQATLSESDTISIDVSVTNGADFISATSANVELDVEMTAVGDPEIVPHLRNDPESPNDYTVGSLVIDHETGTGSFTFTAEDDNISEGREIITLTIADPGGNLPDEWNIGDARSRFTVTVPGNDNAARFAEWPRNDPGSFAGLSLTLTEGVTNDPPRENFIVLIDHIAPGGNLPFLLSVPDEYRNDIGFRNVESNRTRWDSASGVFTFRHSGSIRQAPNIAAGLEIFAVADDDTEREETFEITLMEAPGWPSEWGGVVNTPDIVDPTLATATTLSVTIPANGNTVSFAEAASSAIEDAGTHNVPIRIERAFPEPVTLTITAGGTATRDIDYTVDTQIVIPANNATANIVVTPIPDTVFEFDETIDLTISGTLPETWNFGDNNHRITIINDDSGGIVEIAPGNLQATLSESDTITIDVSVINETDFIAATSANVELDVEMTLAGEPKILPDFRNDPESANDYTVGSLVINHETGMGSFTFTAEDDDIPEGREFITLTIADPDGNLPDEWYIGDARSRFTVIVPGNDNAARFAEWPRNDPGSFAGLSLTLSEGETNDPPRANFVVLIDHIAPNGNLPFLLSVPDEYRDDIGFRNVENRRSEWNSASGVFTFRRSEKIQQAPNIAAGLEIFAVADDGPEREETFEITLMEAPGWPGEWGSVANTPDIVNPALATATTFSITIPANGNTVSFAETASSAIEDTGTHNIPVRIEHAFSEPVTLAVATGGTATNGIDYTVESQIVIPANSATAGIPVTLIPDSAAENEETIELSISGTLPNGWSFGNTVHSFTILDNDSSGIVEITNNPLHATLAESDTITINVALTNSADFMIATSTNVELDVEMTAVGDPDVVPAHRNDPESANDYTVGNLVIDRETGTGSFTFTVEDDDIAEGKEIITLALADPGGRLPYGWVISDTKNEFVVTVPGNDNALRFSEWPRNDPGSFAGLSATIAEGETGNMNVLIDHIAPEGGLRFFVYAPEEYIYEFGFFPTDSSRILTYKGGESFFLRNGNINQEPNLAGSFEIRVDEDDKPELEQTFDITLVEAPNWANEWGSVMNAPDIRTPAVETSPTFSLTIPASDNTVSFADSVSSTAESLGTHNVPVHIHHPLTEPVTLTVTSEGSATNGTDYIVDSQIVIPADSENASVAVTLIPDSTLETSEYIDLTIGGTLPNGWSFDNTTHRITILDGEPRGFVEIANTSPNATLSEPGTVTVDVIVTNSENFATAASEDILLEVELTAAGDPDITTSEFRNDPESENDYTVGNLFIDYKTGTGNFTFTVEDDNIPEGRETVTLALKDPDGNLPDGWLISDAASRFTVNVPANDNAARFFLRYIDSLENLWNMDTNRQPTVTIAEGATGNPPHLNIIIDHIAPDGGLPLLVSVPGEYNDDINFENIDDRRSEWDSINNNFLFLRGGDIDQEANLVAGLRLLAEDDDEPEPEETFNITLMESPGWPGGWGSVADTYPFLFSAPFTTLSVIIPASDNTATFAPTNPASVIESVGMMDIAINLTNNAPAEGLPLTLTASGDTGAISFDETNPDVITSDFSIAAGTSSGQVTVYIRPDDNDYPESVTFTLAAGPDFPDGWGGVPAGETFTLDITEPDPAGGTIAFALPGSEFTEPANGSASNFVTINVTGTLPPGGFPFMVAVDSASTASDSDYSVTPPLSNVLAGNATVVDGVLTLDFSVFSDDIPETDETIQLSIPADQTLPRGWRVISPNTHTISISDNDEFIASSGESGTELTGRLQTGQRRWGKR